MNGPVTARLTNHARERCAEMGISTKVAKAIIRHAHVVRPSRGHLMAVWDERPDYAVLFSLDDPRWPVIVTVLFRNQADYACREVA